MKPWMTVGMVALLVASLGRPANAKTDFMALGTVEGQWFNAKFVGVTERGDKFEISPDGTAEVSANNTQADGRGDVWRIACVNDAMTDIRECTLEWWIPASLMMRFNKPASPSRLCVTNTNLLIGEPLIRMNRGVPIKGLRGGCFSPAATAEIMKQFSVGSNFRSRTIHLGDIGLVDIEAEVTGPYTTARDLVQFMFDKKDRVIAWPKRP